MGKRNVKRRKGTLETGQQKRRKRKAKKKINKKAKAEWLEESHIGGR